VIDRLRELTDPGYGPPETGSKPSANEVNSRKKRREPRSGPVVQEVTPDERKAGSAAEAAPKKDPRIRRPYSEQEMAEMRSVRSARYPGDDPEYHHAGSGRTMWERAEHLGSIAPVMGNPSIDPANGDLITVSYMAGYGGEAEVGHDAMQGVDRMVTDPRVDATSELRFESHHGGPHLSMTRDESIFSGDAGWGEKGLTYDEGPAQGQDWCLGMTVQDDERPLGGTFDWTNEL